MRTSKIADHCCRFLSILLMVYLHLSALAFLIVINDMSQPIANWFYFFLCNAGMAFVYVNYYLTSTIDPGFVPANFHHPLLPVCQSCGHYKPPRTHHCSVCDRCVLVMDHHCPWVGGCIGYFNLPFFLRFLFFVLITSVVLFSLNFNLLRCLSYPMLNSSSSMFSFSRPFASEASTFVYGSPYVFSAFSYALRPVLISLLFKEIYKRQMILLSNCIILGIVFFSVLILFVRQMINLVHGRTYIEGLEQETLSEYISYMIQNQEALNADEKLAILNLQHSSKFPYDLGAWENIRSVFSHPQLPTLAAAFCCMSRQHGDGIHFGTIYGDEKQFVKWPPISEASYMDDDEEEEIERVGNVVEYKDSPSDIDGAPSHAKEDADVFRDGQNCHISP